MSQSLKDKDVVQLSEEVKTSTDTPAIAENELINASGHVQELDRNYSLLSLAGQGIVVGNVWPVLGGSIAISIFNGGAPGAIYEFAQVDMRKQQHSSICLLLNYGGFAGRARKRHSFCGWCGMSFPFIPTLGHDSRFLPRDSPISVPDTLDLPVSLGFYNPWSQMGSAGWVLCGLVELDRLLQWLGIPVRNRNICVQLYAINHPGFEPKPWHVFVGFVAMCWLSTFVLCAANRVLPYMNTVGLFFLLAGFLITLVTVVVMPGMDGRPGHAPSNFIWCEWQADIGYPNGFVFLLGMLNGAYAVGTPDCLTHLAEEIPHPKRNLPKAIGLQQATGFFTGLFYLIAILYSINDYSKLSESSFPLAEIYHQASGSAAGTTGLLIISFFPQFLCTIAGFISNGRTFWALARDEAMPFSSFLSRVDRRLHMPFRAQITVGVITTLLGCIYVGSTAAFNAFVGSFIVNSTASYVAAILPHVVTRRQNIIPGPFFMKGAVGNMIHAISIIYILVFIVIYCFPATLPVNAESMNYASLIFGGLTIFISAWWFAGPRHGRYEGPRASGGEESQAEAVPKVDLLPRDSSV